MFDPRNHFPLSGNNPRVFIASAGLVLAVAAAGAFFQQETASVVAALRHNVNPFLEWYYVALVTFLLFFMGWLGVGRYKNVRLGGDDERPEFTFRSWVSMLLASSTGIGILFWAVAQPILQFQGNPFADGANTPDEAIIAMRLTFFHWGLNGWAVYSFVALVLGYFAFRKGLPLTIRSTLQPLLGLRRKGGFGDLVDVIAVFATVFGITTTLGLGVQQMSAGLGHVAGVQSSTMLQLVIIVAVMVLATGSLVAGSQRGVQWLSEAGYWLSIIIAGALALFGPTQYLFGLIVESAGAYIQHLLEMTFYTGATHDSDWQSEWTVFYWGWWLAWSPFVGMFVARISRGRTFREFIMGVLLVPTVVTSVWLGLFGGTALYLELFEQGGIIEAVSRDLATAVFVTIDAMRLGLVGEVISVGLLLLVAILLTTSANAGTLVVNTILCNGSPEPPTSHRILWGAILAVLTAVLLLSGGLKTLQSAVILAAIPFSFVVIAMIFALLKSLRGEIYAARKGTRDERPREPWGEVENAGEHSSQEKAIQRFRDGEPDRQTALSAEKQRR